MQSDLKTLRYFLALSDTLSFTSAAAKLRMSQPALSLAMQKLEEQLGIALLSRTSRSVMLTPAGLAYARGAREVLALVDQVERSAQEVASGREGLCRIGFVQSASFDVVPQFLRQVQEQAPRVRLQLNELTSTEQLAKLAEGEIDIGMVRQGLVPSDELTLTLIHRQRMVAALPAGHALAKRPAFPLALLEGERFITNPDHRSPALNARVRAACAVAGFQPRAALEAVEMATILAFVGEGLGVALLPASCRRFADRRVALVDLEDATEHLNLPLYLARRAQERDATVKRVAQIAQMAVPSYGAQTLASG